MGRPRTKSDLDEGFIAFGSDEHRDFLGVDQTEDPKRKAELTAQLNTRPVPGAKPIKRPINVRNYDKNEAIIDGWKRR